MGGQHSAEAAGGKVQKRRPPSDSVQGHIWCVIYLYSTLPVQTCFFKLFFSFYTVVKPICFWSLSLPDAFSQIIANEGVRTLWNGTLPSLILVLNPAVQFMIYEGMKRRAGKGGKKVRGHCTITGISQPRVLLDRTDSSFPYNRMTCLPCRFYRN